jgi:hypothetical protein
MHPGFFTRTRILLTHPGFSLHTLDSPGAPWILHVHPGFSSRTPDSPPYENVVNFTMVKILFHHGKMQTFTMVNFYHGKIITLPR